MELDRRGNRYTEKRVLKMELEGRRGKNSIKKIHRCGERRHAELV